MNQTLYESLSKKAAHLMPEDRLNPYDYGLYMKILTRLTVEECVRVCNKQTPNWKGEYATAFGDGVEFCISGIKEHFGVEL